jgi:hypothetical protein
MFAGQELPERRQEKHIEKREAVGMEWNPSMLKEVALATKRDGGIGSDVRAWDIDWRDC